jgi:hypothetical protein
MFVTVRPGRSGHATAAGGQTVRFFVVPGTDLHTHAVQNNADI